MRSRAFVVALVLGIAPAGLVGGASAALTSSSVHSYVVVLNDGSRDPGAVAAALAKREKGSVSHVFRYALRGFSIAMPSDRLTDLQANSDVFSVQPDAQFSADSVQILTHSVDRVDGDLSSTVSGDHQGSVNVNVAVIDEGIDSSHPDLNVSGGVSCTGDDPIHPPAGAYHGTMVAGWIGARDNGIGIVGVAPDARLFSVQALHPNGRGSTAEIICGIDAVTATRLDADPSNDISVANMSLGGADPDNSLSCATGTKDAEHRAICASVGAGVTYVASAGNESKNFARTAPASFDEVLTATAITDTDGQPGAIGSPVACTVDVRGGAPHSTYRDDLVAKFSNYAADPADQAHVVAAPGVCVTSTYLLSGCATAANPNPTECYGFGSGTSFASPVVAGTVALCIAAGPCAGLTPAQIVTKIVADAAAYNNANPSYGYTGDPLRPITGNYYGYLIRAGNY